MPAAAAEISSSQLCQLISATPLLGSFPLMHHISSPNLTKINNKKARYTRTEIVSLDRKIIDLIIDNKKDKRADKT